VCVCVCVFISIHACKRDLRYGHSACLSAVRLPVMKRFEFSSLDCTTKLSC